ncbi:MAG: hypothetical protein NW224_22035 [Leptolyngbyaceae cyanobacterium bins.302]|nr:hypothetical protein [Leptolyngbyaceae cyanobacterium bins.302]
MTQFNIQNPESKTQNRIYSCGTAPDFPDLQPGDKSIGWWAESPDFPFAIAVHVCFAILSHCPGSLYPVGGVKQRIGVKWSEDTASNESAWISLFPCGSN